MCLHLPYGCLFRHFKEVRERKTTEKCSLCNTAGHFRSSISSLIFCLLDLPITVEVSSCNSKFVSLFFLVVLSFCLAYFDSSLGTHTFRITVSPWRIDPLTLCSGFFIPDNFPCSEVCFCLKLTYDSIFFQPVLVGYIFLCAVTFHLSLYI